MIDTKALRSRVLDLAIWGKLTEQLPSDGTAEELYQQIQAEKQTLIKEGKIKKEKPLPGISADEIPFKIPSNWKWVRLQAIANSIWAGRDKPDDFVPVKDEFRTIPVVANGVTDEGILGYTATATAPKNSITVAGRGTIGFSVHRIYDYCPIIRLIVIEQSSFIEPKYLQLIMVKFPESSVGSSIPQLTVPMIKPKIIPLPPLAEQKRIVERVEEIFRLLDTIDEAQEKYSTDAQILEAKLITAGIQGKLTEQFPSDGTAEELYQQIQEEKQKLIKEGKLKKEKPLPPIKPEEIPFEIPGNWKWVRLKTVLLSASTGPFGSMLHKSDYAEKGVPLINPADIVNSTVSTQKIKRVAFQKAEEMQNYRLFEGNIVIGRRGEMGRAAIITKAEEGFLCGTGCFFIMPSDALYAPYFIILLQTNKIRDCLRQGSVGSTMDNLNHNILENLPIPLPPLAEQKRIVDVLERVMGVV